MKTVAILILLFLSFNPINAQFSFPMVGKTNDDFSSAYGSRDRKSGADYDYDWHAAIDIAGANNDVVPVLDGEVIHVKRNNDYPYKQSVFVHHADDYGDFIVEYQHIIPAVSEGDQVTGGISVLGTTADYLLDGPSNDHLDFRYFNNKSNYNDIDVVKYSDTSHPWEILQSGGDFSSEVKIMEDQNNELYS